ncbi:class I SAM-dependent methyltransferase [Caballeronia sp. SEWSISQ10-4 2]|uniref:class I SAM-dependent methyltransferase n=1 Tax=Caballeronia sp. SEWSISQ10-4 2 TaxID=2937438 RepID=UPI00264AD593|nr:class I SAM-dependent methyltransferase [Caballeronia sp. SEWSISQ10-4 2]MDN7179704.1 class I SAM-dependent methyltransferase [Caballeronia sp. SEWSISQ10-4 2]
MILDNFYSALEDRFRGSRQVIKERQSLYLPLVDALSLRVRKKILDVGCGRSEWLELLEERGIESEGLDTNEEFVTQARQAGLDVSKADVMEHLRQQPDQSYGLVSAFHVVEHLGFENLLLFLREAYRVIDDDGALLLETPNPANLLVGACTFYLDPTHERPLPSALLGFAAEFAGFARVVVLPVNRAFLQNNLEFTPDELPGADVINKVVSSIDQNFMQAPDYAVIAFKKAGNELAGIAESLTLHSPLPVSAKGMEEVNALLAQRRDQEEVNALLAHRCDQEAELRAAHLAELRAVHLSVIAAEDRARRSQEHVIALLSSSSWRLSSPVRGAGVLLRNMAGLPRKANSFAKLFLRHVAAYIRCRPRLKKRAESLLRRVPKARTCVVLYAGLTATQEVENGALPVAVAPADQQTAHSHVLHADLINAESVGSE